jgi:yeast amino acid transporter
MLVPYDSKNLAFANKASTSAAASPFVVAIIDSGIHTLPSFLNGCILLFVFSAANSDLYISSRTLYSLAKEGNAPSLFARTSRRGVPIYALALSGALACIAFMNVSESSTVVFGYFVNLVTIFGILTWISILVTHICFVRARIAQGLTKTQMPYTAPLGAIGSAIALFLCIIITIFKNFDVFIRNSQRTYGPNFDYRGFITGYLGIPIYLVMIFGHKILKQTKGIKPSEVDLYTGKEAIDQEEQDFVANRDAEKRTNSGNWFYRHFVAWLF